MSVSTRWGGANRPWYGRVLLALVIVMLFIVPVLPAGLHHLLYNLCLTAILFSAALSIDRDTNRMIAFALGLTLVEWISFFLDLALLVAASRLLILIFFVWIVVRLIMQIAGTRIVTGRVIIEAINGYLLLGIVFPVIVMVVTAVQSGAFSAGAAPPFNRPSLGLNEGVYFGFVTFTTLGYGDIVPKTTAARSVAGGASVAGRMYLTVIIAMLVGKFLSRSREER